MTPEPYRNHTTTAQREHHYGPIVSMEEVARDAFVPIRWVVAAVWAVAVVVGVMAHG